MNHPTRLRLDHGTSSTSIADRGSLRTETLVATRSCHMVYRRIHGHGFVVAAPLSGRPLRGPVGDGTSDARSSTARCGRQLRRRSGQGLRSADWRRGAEQCKPPRPHTKLAALRGRSGHGDQGCGPVATYFGGTRKRGASKVRPSKIPRCSQLARHSPQPERDVSGESRQGRSGRRPPGQTACATRSQTNGRPIGTMLALGSRSSTSPWSAAGGGCRNRCGLSRARQPPQPLSVRSA